MDNEIKHSLQRKRSKPSLKYKLLDYFKINYPRDIPHWTIEDFGKGWGFLGDTARRRADELVKEGLVSKSFKISENGREYTAYKLNTPKEEKDMRSIAQIQGRRRLEKVFVDGEWKMREIIEPIVI